MEQLIPAAAWVPRRQPPARASRRLSRRGRPCSRTSRADAAKHNVMTSTIPGVDRLGGLGPRPRVEVSAVAG